MTFSPEGIIQATFDPEWATCSLVVDGGLWPSQVAVITIDRSVPGLADMPVRGAQRRNVVGGYFVGSDSEMPLNSTVAYTVSGFSSSGSLVGTASATVETSGTACGAWIKVAGQPNLTVRAELVSTGEVTSTTQGGVYDIAGGGLVAAAAVTGVGADQFSLGLRGVTDAQAGSIAAALRHRILLIQSCVHQPFESGWYYVSTVSRSLRAAVSSFPGRDFAIDLVATGVPSGVGQGIAGWSWAGVTGTHPAWEAVSAAHPSWWSLLREAS